MDSGFRILVMAACAYLLFLCIIRWVLGGQYKVKSFLVALIGVLTVFGGFIVGVYGSVMHLPAFLIYAVPVLLVVMLPTLSLKMNSDQILKYLVLAILALPFLHAFFSFFLGWSQLIPYLKIPSFWSLF